jgi:hypothetical protein
MSLIFPKVVNFKNFYETNQKEVDRILWSICWKHQQIFNEPKELFNELYIRLNRSSFLNDFDPARTQLHTYFTNRANFYARHMVTKAVKDFKNFGPKVICQGLNTIGEDETAIELASYDNFEEALASRDLIEQAREKTNNNQLVELLEEGMNQVEIAKHLKVSKFSVQNKITNMKASLRKLCPTGTRERPVKSKPVIIRIKPVTMIKRTKPLIITKEFYMKNQNHHAIAKVRTLSEDEIKSIRNRFIELDGVIPDDTWKKLKETMKEDVSVFQITGQVVKLHNEVKNGSIILKDKKAYLAAIQAKRNKWKTYNSPKYKLLAKRTSAKAKKVTATIAKRVKATTKAINITKATTITKVLRFAIFRKNKWEERNIPVSVPKDTVKFAILA